jgi:hypothetical protein
MILFELKKLIFFCGKIFFCGAVCSLANQKQNSEIRKKENSTVGIMFPVSTAKKVDNDFTD